MPMRFRSTQRTNRYAREFLSGLVFGSSFCIAYNGISASLNKIYYNDDHTSSDKQINHIGTNYSDIMTNNLNNINSLFNNVDSMDMKMKEIETLTNNLNNINSLLNNIMISETACDARIQSNEFINTNINEYTMNHDVDKVIVDIKMKFFDTNGNVISEIENQIM